MKDLGVLLPKGSGDEEGGRREKEKTLNCKKDCIMPFVFLPHLFLYFKSHNNLSSQLGCLIVNQCAILARQQAATEHAQTSI